MTFDEQIKKTLRENSEWLGSPQELWDKIAKELEPKKRWWQRPPLWLGSAAAAVVLLFLLQGVWNPLPPTVPENQEPIQMKTFTALIAAPEPEQAAPGAELELPVDIYLTPTHEGTLSLIMVKQEAEGETIVQELSLDGTQLLAEQVLKVQAPLELGTYRLTVQGTFQAEGQLYSAWAEKIIEVGEGIR